MTIEVTDIQGNKTTAKEMPDGWHQLNFADLLALSRWKIRQEKKPTDDPAEQAARMAELYELFTGVPADYWLSDAVSYEADRLTILLDWINYQPEQATPEAVKIGSKTVAVPMDLARLSVGQKLMFQGEITNQAAKHKDDILEATLSSMPYCIAVYLEPLYSGKKSDGSRVKDFVPLVMSANGLDMLAIGNFFLTALLKSGNNGLNPLSKLTDSKGKRRGTRRRKQRRRA